MCLALLPLLVAAQARVTLSGFVRDAESGEPLIGAAVMDATSSGGVVTNNFGFYSMSVPKGVQNLVASCLGYSDYSFTVDAQQDQVYNILLKPAAEFLEGATVTASQSEIGVRGTQMSAIEVPVNQIRSVPALGGEVDLIKALQLLPGVQSGTEGAAGLYVRGGGPDENLLLLDGVPIYNINHLFGFFSAFDADAIKNVTLYKGSFPARFGSRLSSVVDIRMKDGNDQEIKGSASVGLISARFNMEGPIVKGKTTFNVSARRTYGDVTLLPIILAINAKMNQGEQDKDRILGGYYFYDLNAKVTHRFSDNDNISLSFYTGDDVTYVNMKEKFTDGSTNLKLDWRWGNLVSSLHWNHVFGPQLFMSATANYTRYRHHLGIGMDDKSSLSGYDISESLAMAYDSGINDASGSVEFEYKPHPSHDVRFGGTYVHHMFNPSVSSISMQEQLGTEKAKIDTTFGDSRIYSNEYSLYAEDNWSVTDWFKFNAGVRCSLYGVSNKTYGSVEPRLSTRILLTPDLSIKASYSEMSQYVHMLSNSSLSLPTDLWVPVTARIKPMRSRQGAVGLFYSWDVFDFSIESYYKTMDNILEYRDGATFLGSTAGWEDKVAMGRGWAYGTEFFVQKKVGNTTGWIGYTWSRSFRQFDQPGNVINNGQVFPAKYDRIHDLSATVSHNFNKKWDVSATFIYGTGTTGSLPMQNIVVPDYGPDGTVQGFSKVGYLEGRNNYRMPPYHRLDIGANHYRQTKHGRIVTNISVYNVYNHKNPFLVYSGTKSEYDYNTGEYHNTHTLTQVSIFPILPSIAFTYEF